jgi:hypothetical protein
MNGTPIKGFRASLDIGRVAALSRQTKSRKGEILFNTMLVNIANFFTHH